MIIGLGIDLCDEVRILNTYKRFNQRFTERLCSVKEQVMLQALPEKRRISRLTMLFAAKEAMSKALGTGIRKGVYWRDMEVTSEKSGKPGYKLYGGALAQLNHITPHLCQARCVLSLTRESGMAAAVAIVEAYRH